MHKSYISHFEKEWKQEWKIIIHIWLLQLLRKNKYQSIVDPWSYFLYDCSYIASTILSTSAFLQDIFPRFSAERRLYMLLLEEIFDFKWQNGIFLAKRRDRKKARNKSFSAMFSFSFRNKKKICGVNYNKTSVNFIFYITLPAINMMLLFDEYGQRPFHIMVHTDLFKFMSRKKLHAIYCIHVLLTTRIKTIYFLSIFIYLRMTHERTWWWSR